ncbi:MAG TPA: hypothetical protein VMR65_03925 [Candidatus Sulfotelmatobacter sp.]|nr:hypothetical protein [Candidatus Sulfotelmatobacter sp.]
MADAPLASFGTGAEGSTVIFHDEHGERFDPFLGELGVAREPQPGSAAVHRLAVADPRVQDRILERLAGNGAHIVSVTPERPSLEAAFLRLTSAGDAAS